MFYIFRWFTYFCRCIDGLLGMVTFGFYDSGINLLITDMFIDYCDKHNLKRKNK
jgi:hypothetical protein